MKWILLFILIILLFMPIHIHISIKWNGKFNIKISLVILFGLIKYKFDTAKIKSQYEGKFSEKYKEHKDKKIFDMIKKIKKYYSNNKKWINCFLRKAKIKKIYWLTSFGLGDAALTGISTGILWSVKNWVLGIITNNKKVKEIYVNIFPNFNSDNIESQFSCIISWNFVYIIIVSLYLLIMKIKGGEKNANTSYSRTYGNNNE
ncbi:MAG: DUF2953 domain-containing protein [Sporanaerobacter sp.]|jgi:hypothetical protein|uniref:DUF2953 domain-containing protein n=1 Tax=Sporanaerobacter sp. TaxID=2010183 RepID=UPI003A100A90